MNGRRAIVALLGVLVTAGGTSTAQRDRLPKWRIDPYTKNDPEVMKRLGYVSYGPFPFGQRGAKPVTSDEIDAFLHYARILWVETAHLRIGSTLEAWTVPFDPEVKAKIRGELTRLKERGQLQKVNPKTRTLDPWLRLHLFAQRLEDHYALMQDWLGVTDDSFPKNEEERSTWTGDYMGEGPFLGERGKYLFLVFEETSTYKDYLKNFVGRDSVMGQQWNFKGVDSMLYSCGADNNEEGGRLRDDTAMHCHLVHAATHNLLNGYLHYNYDMPVWIREGLAHYFERLISPRYNSYTRSEGSAPLANKQWRFAVETRQLVASGKFAPFSEVYTWRDFGQMDFDAHVTVWSRWDFLMGLGKKRFADFLRRVKGRINPDGTMEDNLVEASRHALQKVYGLSPLTLDERWKEWVKESYPLK